MKSWMWTIHKLIHVEHAPVVCRQCFQVEPGASLKVRQPDASIASPRLKCGLSRHRPALSRKGAKHTQIVARQEAFSDLRRKEVQILTWLGDGANEAIACLLGRLGPDANADGQSLVLEPNQCAQGQAETLEYSIVETDWIDAGLDAPPDVHQSSLHERSNLEREKGTRTLSGLPFR